jgi:chorismate dehydratase
VRTVIVSYLNTLPLREALKNFSFPGFTIESMPPSHCNAELIGGKADLGLAPVITLLQNQNLQRIGSIGICSKKYVHSVGVFSNVPLNQLNKIFLDPESRTSVLLLKWLCKHHWNINPIFEDLSISDFTLENNTDCGYLLIGDKALKNHGKWKYYTDLVEAWNLSTGLPFVFAAWIGYREKIPNDFIDAFNRCQLEFINKLSTLHHHPEINVFGRKLTMKYLTEYISYSIESEEDKAIEFFLSEIRKFLT